MTNANDQVYAPPTTPLRLADPDATRSLRRVRNGLVAAALLVQLVALASGFLIAFTLPLGLILLLCASIAQATIAQRRGEETPVIWRDALLTFFGWSAVQTGIMVGAVIIAEYLGNGFRRGRQVRDRGVLVLAPLAENDAWQELDVACPLAMTERNALADQWRDNGLTEHASVIAFAKLTLELMELGAPAELVMAAQQDGLDESRHTAMCFSLARAIDGRAIGPNGFPVIAPARHRDSSRRARLQRLAVDALFDGVIHEGVSARIVAQLAKLCTESAIKDTLTTIARDEGRHAAHAGDVLDWCIATGGEAVRDAVLGALQQIPADLDVTSSPRAASGAWETYGIAGAAFSQEAYALTLAHVRRKFAKKRAA